MEKSQIYKAFISDMPTNWKRYKDSNFAFSDKGEIFNLKTEKYLKTCAGILHIRIEGKQETISVKRCIWELFKGKIPYGYLVCAIDGNSENCSLDNLKLVPKKEVLSLHRSMHIRKIRCLETNHVYKNLRECSEEIPVCRMSLWRHLKYNKPDNFSGKHYVYEDDYQESIS